ncbi:MAG: glycerate kinase type-2 family protein [Candidatus Binataceae bacterium]
MLEPIMSKGEAAPLTPMGRDLRRIYDAAVAAVAPGPLIARALSGAAPGSAGIPQKISAARRIFVIAAGKAALAMAREVMRHCSGKIARAIAAVPAAALDDIRGSEDIDGLTLYRAGHPAPDSGSLRAADAAMALAADARPGDLLIFALSGGASAMLAKPVPAVPLDDKIAVSAALMRAGASIQELNTVRKHLSAIKGGGLLRNTAAGVLTLAMSDVIGNDLATIGSGPTAADPTTFGAARNILKRRGIWGRAPETVRGYLERGAAGEVAETLKPDDPALSRATAIIIGDNDTAVSAGAEAASALGYQVDRWDGFSREAAEACRIAAARIVRLADETAGGKTCMIGGGEPVVKLRGDGRGGRAQHCALALAAELENYHPKRHIAALIAGTDGIDGPTDAAGAFVDHNTIVRARLLGLDSAAALSQCDSYSFFQDLGDLLITGPSGANVSDLIIALTGLE